MHMENMQTVHRKAPVRSDSGSKGLGPLHDFTDAFSAKNCHCVMREACSSDIEQW